MCLLSATFPGKRFTQKEFKSFLSEAVIMKDFDHINVLSLYGVVIKEDKPYVILPYMEHGDLKSFIINPAQVRISCNKGKAYSADI